MARTRMRLLVAGSVALGSVAVLASGCDDCHKTKPPICGLLGPAEASAHQPIPLTVTYEMSGCVNLKRTWHTVDGTTITLHGDAEHCCQSCSCGLGIEVDDYSLPGLEPGTYRVRADVVASQTCDASRDGPPSFDLVVH